MNQELTKQTGYIVGLVVLVLLWAFAYAIPRMGSNRALAEKNDQFLAERREIALALQAYAELPPERPAPTPNTSSWVSSNALTGIESNVESNSPYANGAGVQLKIRAISANQISALLLKLREVNLLIKSLKIEDRDGDGRWNVELMTEVPQ